MNENNNAQNNVPGDMDARLWNFIDGTVNNQEKSVIEKLLEANEEWKSRHIELLKVNELLNVSELEAPSLRFTKNVMEEIGRLHIAPATRSYINKKIIWSIGFFFIAMLIGILIYAFGQASFSGGEETSFSKTMNKFDLSKIFSNTWVNIFMMINVLLLLVLLDHYLGNKRKAFRKERL